MSEYTYCNCGFGWDDISKRFHDCTGKQKSPCVESGTEEKEELKPANQHPDFGKVCSHGQLKRKCYTCELEEEIDRLELQSIQSEAHREQMSKELVEDGVMLEKLRDEVTRLKAQNEKYREALDRIRTSNYFEYIAEEALKGE